MSRDTNLRRPGMIIECQTCHTRFRLDESRIKGRGARVKCRKCGESIIVLKDSAPAPAPPAPPAAPAPPAPGREGFFDLGSAVRESIGESHGSPPPVGNLIPFPAPSRPVEPFAAESSSPAPEAAGPGRDEVDLAFDRVLFPGAEASSPSIGEKEADPGALTLDFGPEEKLDLPPAEEMEPPFFEPPPDAPSAEFRGEGGFLISDSDTLDFPKEKHRVAGPSAPPEIGDISLEIFSAPGDETRSSLHEPDASPPPAEDWASPTPEGISLEGNATPPAAEPVVEVPPYREAEPAPEPPGESPARRGSPATESLRPRSSAGPAVAAALAVLLAAVVYLVFTTSGRKTLEGAIPGVSALWGGKPAPPAGPNYDLRNVIGYYESGGASRRILVIKGQVANLSTVEKSGIRIHATLLDNADVVLGQQAVYAGNVLPVEAIRKGDRNTLSKALDNRFGEGLANMHVAPGKAIPFMVVFFDAPANMDSYKLEAKDGE
jgi:predicted Zn finger-like uncharacterized protein